MEVKVFEENENSSKVLSAKSLMISNKNNLKLTSIIVAKFISNMLM